MRLLLTDRFCARAKPQSAQTDYFDETVKGLALRVGKQRKSWTLHLTANGVRRRLTLGLYPAMSLAAARTRALTIAQGGDPAEAETFKTVRPGPPMFFLTHGRQINSISACMAPSWPKHG